MTQTLFIAAIAAVLVAAPSSAPAQDSSPVGRWSIEYERGRRVENGEATAIMGAGVLTIVQQGDSLLATLAPAARPDGTPSATSTFGGRMTPAGAVFVQKQTVQLNMNGEMSSRAIELTWRLQASGNTLTGTLARQMPGMDESAEPSPVKGTRAPG